MGSSINLDVFAMQGFKVQCISPKGDRFEAVRSTEAEGGWEWERIDDFEDYVLQVRKLAGKED